MNRDPLDSWIGKAAGAHICFDKHDSVRTLCFFIGTLTLSPWRHVLGGLLGDCCEVKVT